MTRIREWAYAALLLFDHSWFLLYWVLAGIGLVFIFTAGTYLDLEIGLGFIGAGTTIVLWKLLHTRRRS